MNDNKEKIKKDKKPIKERFSETAAKVKKIKNIEVIICIILIAVILLLYGVVREAKKKKEDGGQSSVNVVEITADAAAELSEILSQIKGAGKVKVLITYDGSPETVYAYDTATNTVVREDNSGGSTIVTTTTEETSVPVFVTVDGVKKPLVTKELSPKIKGVVIVAEGASDIGVRLQLMRAAAAALDIKENIIEIFIMN